MGRILRRVGAMSVAVAALVGCSPGTAPRHETAAGEATAAREVREARERFNQAIVDRDLETIASLLVDDYHLVTGNSVQYHGADRHLELWSSVFESDPVVVYRRTPREVRLNQAWGLAEELGNWEGTYTAAGGGTVDASGVYAAKWQRATDGGWLLQSEVFTTLTCEGPEGGCRTPAPIDRSTADGSEPGTGP